MPPIDAIQPEENRLFTTSIGDWITDGQWQQNSAPPPVAWMVFHITPEDQPKGATLTSPAIAPLPATDYNFSFAQTRLIGFAEPTTDWKLTIGNITIQGSLFHPLGFGTVGVNQNISLPLGTDVSNAKITITINPDPQNDIHVGLHHFSLMPLQTHKKIDYLPILGIG